MVPKSIAAMLPECTRKPDCVLGTRLATTQPFDVFRTSPMFAILPLNSDALFHCMLRRHFVVFLLPVFLHYIYSNVLSHNILVRDSKQHDPIMAQRVVQWSGSDETPHIRDLTDNTPRTNDTHLQSGAQEHQNM